VRKEVLYIQRIFGEIRELKMKICVVGLGYIGLPTASILATRGFDVVGVDTNRTIVSNGSCGKTDIEEPGLSTIVAAAVKSGKLQCQGGVVEADIFIICVPTPITKEKRADLAYLEAAARSVASKLRKENLVILESTVPPRTTEDVLRPILEESGLVAGEDFYLAHCPERVLPGNLLNELIKNDRIIGGIDKKSKIMARDIYKTFVEGNIYLTDSTTAEFVKLMENSTRAVNIALANEFALIAEKIGINVLEAIDLANKHPRINVLYPGAGVGGHCIPVDPWFLVEKAKGVSRLIPVSMDINEIMPEHVISLVLDAFSEAKKDLNDAKIAVLGAAYKGDVNDARESPAIPVIRSLRDMGANVVIYDPLVTKFQFKIEKYFKKAVIGSDALVILTDHSEFKEMNMEEMKRLMNKAPILVDGRNIIRDSKGFIFRGVGR